MIIIPELLNPKLYLQKPIQSQILNKEDETSIITEFTDSIYHHSNILNNNLINFISFFQKLLRDEIVIEDYQIKDNIKIIYETIKEINIYLSNLKLNNNNNNNNQNNSNQNIINFENDQDQFDLSFLLELLYQFILVNSSSSINIINHNYNNNSSSSSNNNNRIEIFLWIFKIISLIISQDYDKVYIEILLSMGLLNHLKRLNRDIIVIIDTLKINNNNNNDYNSNNNSNDSSSSGGDNNIELDIYLKIQFLINDIINQINNFNNSKYIFKKLYFNYQHQQYKYSQYQYQHPQYQHQQDYIEITIRQLLYNNVGLGYKIWESSLLLSEIIIRNSSLFKDKIALELGSGVGVGGIIASRYTKSIVLTDFVDSINDNIKFNIDENFNINNNNNNSGSSSSNGNGNIIKSNYQIFNLDWNNLNQSKLKENSFDVVFGSDLIYCQSAAKQIPIVLSKYLVVGGISLLVLPNCREGISEFEYDLQSSNSTLKVLERHLIKNLGDDGELLVLLLSKIQ